MVINCAPEAERKSEKIDIVTAMIYTRIYTHVGGSLCSLCAFKPVFLSLFFPSVPSVLDCFSVLFAWFLD